MKTKNGTDLRLSLLVVPLICQPLSCQPMAYAKEEFDHLHDLDLAESSCDTDHLNLDLLVGSDHYWSLVTGEIKRGSTGPIAIETRVGWVLSGPVQNSSSFVNFIALHSSHALYIDSDSNDQLESGLDRFWNLESLGIVIDESSVHQSFCNTITFKDDRYHVKLPWREEHSELCDNFELSKSRLIHLLKQLRSTPELLQEYDNIIKEQIRNQIVEAVKISETNGQIHCHSYRQIYHQNKNCI